MITLKTQ